MLLSVGRDRRIVGRSAGARLHRDTAAGGRGGAQRHAMLAGARRRRGEFERRADALADRKRAVVDEQARPARAGPAGVGRGAVPRAGHATWAVEART